MGGVFQSLRVQQGLEGSFSRFSPAMTPSPHWQPTASLVKVIIAKALGGTTRKLIRGSCGIWLTDVVSTLHGRSSSKVASFAKDFKLHSPQTPPSQARRNSSSHNQPTTNSDLLGLLHMVVVTIVGPMAASSVLVGSSRLSIHLFVLPGKCRASSSSRNRGI